MRTLIVAALGAAFFMGAGLPARAQVACGERAQVLEHFERRHREQPRAIGILDSGEVLEVLASENGSWTLIVTTTSGIACVIGAGQAWEFIAPAASPPPGEGS